ncbi:efflux RND transporter periplasmic adaptor subunit [Mucilaginibacter hurinus]|uniref:Efflux RND transporter periplasmic adaptor subunit n=1 Tax=Mucilaginibacter hurinus TaxID=2201324 RepID=A0A367GS63_9SPHI|nr:efflux RND transporter periplasmic adaptor subunit [Mucilaginibacter hurinus]RCH56294.1 efflux RND transporter periplasmic adaptor subunit [Mucilaginibacter hurinus]
MNKILVLIGLIALLCHTSCTSKKEEKEVESKLLVTSPLKKDTSVVNDYVCQIRSIRHIELRAQERGYLEKIYVDEGQFVKQGQLLFQIMPRLYEAELQKAQAEVKFAQIEYRNTKRLADSSIVAPNELAMARAKLEKANADLSLTKVHLQFTQIRAPFDGIIDRFLVRQGSLLDEGDLLTTLADNSKMWVYFNVPEAEYLEYKAKGSKDNQQVSLLMANNQQFGHPGVVETIEADFDNETGNIPFRATFPNPDRLLRHGETGNIKMVVPLKNALIIPQKATFEVLDKKYVYILDKDSKVRSREITIGADMEDLYAVTSGLAETDKILLEGLRKVKEGDKIAYEYEEPKMATSQLKLHAE